MQGLLSGNSFYDSDAMCSRDHRSAEELLEDAIWFAERMVAVVEERRQIERFELTTRTDQ
jgi:hypothetical protein